MTRELAERVRRQMTEYFRGYDGWTCDLVQLAVPGDWEVQCRCTPKPDLPDPSHGLGEHCRNSTEPVA